MWFKPTPSTLFFNLCCFPISVMPRQYRMSPTSSGDIKRTGMTSPTSTVCVTVIGKNACKFVTGGRKDYLKLATIKSAMNDMFPRENSLRYVSLFFFSSGLWHQNFSEFQWRRLIICLSFIRWHLRAGILNITVYAICSVTDRSVSIKEFN